MESTNKTKPEQNQ